MSKYRFEKEYDDNDNEIYFESQHGVLVDNRAKPEETKPVIIDRDGLTIEVIGLIKTLYGLDLSHFIKS